LAKTLANRTGGARDAGCEHQTMMNTGVAVRQPGRPRNARYDKEILDAALGILIEKGYSGFTIDGVAAKTGVTRPTIYRRWPSKAALATAVLDQCVPLPTTADTGNLRDDLRAFQKARLDLMNAPATRAIVTGLLSDSVANPALAEAFRNWYHQRDAKMDAILERAIERGELAADVDFDFINDLLLGPLFTRSIMRGKPLKPRLIDDTINVVLATFATSE
jgi:AcrR family transcriptional regulator